MKSLKFITTNSSMKTKKAIFIAALLLVFSMQTFATNYYSRTNGGNWNVNTTWSTVTYGSATNTGTYPKVGDNAFIGDGYTIKINTSVLGIQSVTVGEGRSGVLQYVSGGNYILTVTGNITVSRGAKFNYNTAVAATHTCQVAGNFINDGTVDFYVAAGQVVNL